MTKTFTLELPESDVIELETLLSQMQRANEQMRRDQSEIEVLKLETQEIATQTRAIIAQLEAAN